MFVETGLLLLPLDAPVFVAFDLAGGEQYDDFRLEAMVVRHAPIGVGLMFLDLETDVSRALRRSLYGAPTGEIRQAAQTPDEIGGSISDARDRAVLEVR